MAPLYLPGRYCLCLKARPQNLKKGDVVVADVPVYGKIIKRISTIDQLSSTVVLKGDNPESISSDKIGLVPIENILWRVVWPRA